MKVGIIGGGWYGCHLALALTNQGHTVVMFEKNANIFEGVSGKFGIRLHQGPHYPRSKSTRELCRKSFNEFINTYPELVVEHQYSIYGLGKTDSDGNPPKVDKDTFDSVCRESETCQEVDLESFGYHELQMAKSMYEPSIAIGDRLRQFFINKLLAADVKIHYNFEVKSLLNMKGKTTVIGQSGEEIPFDKIINATGYQSLIPDAIKDVFPVDMEVIFQPCLALSYQDLTPGAGPFSFIVMDGWNPCVMPFVDTDEFKHTYTLTHGSYSIMASFHTPAKAHHLLSSVTDRFIFKKVKPLIEKDLYRYWPEFEHRFKYIGWRGTVLAKMVTKNEFRSALTFEYDNIITILPGKVSNIFDAEREVTALIEQRNCITLRGVTYVAGGVLDLTRSEIAEKPADYEPNTGKLNTWRTLDIPHSLSKRTFFKTKTHHPVMPDDFWSLGKTMN